MTIDSKYKRQVELLEQENEALKSENTALVESFKKERQKWKRDQAKHFNGLFQFLNDLASQLGATQQKLLQNLIGLNGVIMGERQEDLKQLTSRVQELTRLDEVSLVSDGDEE